MKLRPDPDWHVHARVLRRDGLAVKEIAERLGKSVAGVRVALAGVGNMVKRGSTPSLRGQIASAQATHKAPPVSLPTLQFTKNDA